MISGQGFMEVFRCLWFGDREGRCWQGQGTGVEGQEVFHVLGTEVEGNVHGGVHGLGTGAEGGVQEVFHGLGTGVEGQEVFMIWVEGLKEVFMEVFMEVFIVWGQGGKVLAGSGDRG